MIINYDDDDVDDDEKINDALHEYTPMSVFSASFNGETERRW